MKATNGLKDLGLGFMVFVNMSLITWYSKKQSTIETSVFGAKFVAIKVGIKTLRAILYELRMMGITISGASYVYGDNMSVIHNTSKPRSSLKKNSNAIAYHAVCKSMPVGETLTGHI